MRIDAETIRGAHPDLIYASGSALVRDARALVEAVLEVPAPHAVRDRVDEAGGDLDGDELVVVRTVAPNGRGQAHLGGRRVPVSVLGEIGEHVVAIHGQADQWRLRRSDEHRAVLEPGRVQHVPHRRGHRRSLHRVPVVERSAGQNLHG